MNEEFRFIRNKKHMWVDDLHLNRMKQQYKLLVTIKNKTYVPKFQIKAVKSSLHKVPFKWDI